SEINAFALSFISRLNYVYIDNPDTNSRDYAKGRQIANILLSKYNPKALTENMPNSTKNTSFTKNKGEEISLCLREKQSGNNNFHELNDLLFVFIHELAHVVSIEVNHGAEFWTNFKFL